MEIEYLRKKLKSSFLKIFLGISVSTGYIVLGDAGNARAEEVSVWQIPDVTVAEYKEREYLILEDFLLPFYNRGRITETGLNNIANEFLTYEAPVSIFLPNVESWRPLVEDVIREESSDREIVITSNLILILMQMESQGNPNAENPNSGASGLMQIMPQTYRDLRMSGDIKNPRNNVRAAVRLLEYNLQVAKEHGYEGLNAWRYAVTSYNGGPYNGIDFMYSQLNQVPSETLFYAINFTRFVLYSQQIINNLRAQGLDDSSIQQTLADPEKLLSSSAVASIENEPHLYFVVSQLEVGALNDMEKFTPSGFFSRVLDLYDLSQNTALHDLPQPSVKIPTPKQSCHNFLQTFTTVIVTNFKV